MKKVRLSLGPVEGYEITKLDDYFEELRHSWRQKSRDLQNRRWRKLREHSL